MYMYTIMQLDIHVVCLLSCTYCIVFVQHIYMYYVSDDLIIARAMAIYICDDPLPYLYILQHTSFNID